MKFLMLLLLFPVLMAGVCDSGSKATANERATVDSVPDCVRKLIDAGEKETPPNGPVEINEYIYNGRTVYLFTARCCDQFNVLYDSSCSMICAPSGGFSGRGDGKCPDFEKNAHFVKLVWKSNTK